MSFILDGDVKSKKNLTNQQTWAKLKFDRQIVAIAKTRQATMIYTDDEGLGKCAKANGLEVTHTWELPLPPVDVQQQLPLHEPAESAR